jgi:hypothetical protein
MQDQDKESTNELQTKSASEKCEDFGLADYSDKTRHNNTKDEALDYLAQVLVEAYLKKKRNGNSK